MPRKQKDTKRVESEEEENYYGNAKAVQQEDEGEYLQEDEYNVEAIMDMKVELGKKYYFIKWEGFPHSQNTWEPIEHLAKVAYMVEQFEEDYAKGKSLAMMEQENPGYFAPEEEEDFPLRKETKKKNDVNEGNEVLFKKRKLNNIGDDGEILFEKKPIGEENNFDLGEDDGIQEITTIKEDLTKAKPRKKNASKPFTKAPPLEEDFEDENTLKNKSSPSSYLSNKVSAETPALYATQINDSSFDKDSEKGVNGKSARSLRGVVAGNKKTQNKPARTAAKKKDKTGSFRNKDKPQSILSIKLGKSGGFDYLVEWQRRYDGSQPENSMVSNEEMKKNDPYFLIDFYETKVIVVSKNKAKRGKGILLEKEKEPERMNVEEKPIRGIVETPATVEQQQQSKSVISIDEDITVSPPKQKEIEKPRSDDVEKKLIEVVQEHDKELDFISPTKETPAKAMTNKTPKTQERFNSYITSPQEIMSSPGEEIVVNVRETGHHESSPESEKKIAENADKMIGDFDLIEQHNPPPTHDWEQNILETQGDQGGQEGQGDPTQTQEKDFNPSLYSEIHANQAQHFVPSLDSEQLQALQAQRMMQSLDESVQNNEEHREQEEGEKENTGILTETIDEGDKEINDEEDVGKNKENQSSLVSVI